MPGSGLLLFLKDFIYLFRKRARGGAEGEGNLKQTQHSYSLYNL